MIYFRHRMIISADRIAYEILHDIYIYIHIRVHICIVSKSCIYRKDSSEFLCKEQVLSIFSLNMLINN
jgi:hypothetical protein